MKKRILIIFFSLVLVYIFLFVVFNFVIYPKKYDDYVSKYAEQYNIEIPLVYAIIKAESNFNPRAKSKSGAMGLMQLIPRTANWIAGELNEKDFTVDNLYDPETNVKFGCFYLNYLFNKFGDMKVVICAYNAGEGIVRIWLNEDGSLNEDLISYSETKEYLHRVLSNYSIYSNNKIYV